MKPERTPIMEGNEIEKAAEEHECDFCLMCDVAVHYCDCENIVVSDGMLHLEYVPLKKYQAQQAELTRTNAQLDEMVTKYNELSKKYADLYTKHYGKLCQ